MIATDNSAAEEAIRQYLGGESGAYFCKVCDYSGKQKYNLTRHIETHIGGLSYSCTVCHKTYKTRNALNVHESVKFHHF